MNTPQPNKKRCPQCGKHFMYPNKLAEYVATHPSEAQEVTVQPESEIVKDDGEFSTKLAEQLRGNGVPVFAELKVVRSQPDSSELEGLTKGGMIYRIFGVNCNIPNKPGHTTAIAAFTDGRPTLYGGWTTEEIVQFLIREARREELEQFRLEWWGFRDHNNNLTGELPAVENLDWMRDALDAAIEALTDTNSGGGGE